MADVDVAIIGGGPAGTAAALTLRKRSDIRVAVLEKGAYDIPKVGESLSPGVRGLLQYLDVWDRFEREQRLSLLGSEAAWGSDELGAMDFIFTLHGAGWVLDRLRFEAMLAEEATNRGVRLLCRSPVSDIDYDGNVWRLRFGNTGLTARYLIDAAGRTSPFSLSFGAIRQRNDNLTAITARMPLASCHFHMTRVEACSYGWWYAAPLPSGEAILCLFSDAETIHALRLSTPEIWSEKLRQTKHISALADFIGVPEELDAQAAFSGLLVDGTENLPVTAAGDAVASRDPLSSSGIPNAIGTGVQAARVAADWLYGKGELRRAYVQSVAQDHHNYLKTHWKTYQVEQRWPEEPFWCFRSTRVMRGPETPVVAKADSRRSIFVPGKVASWILDAARIPARQADLVADARAAFPFLPDERLLLAVEDLTEAGSG